MGSGHSHDHSAAHGHKEGGHATVTLYVVFCVILCAITFVEWYLFKVREAWHLTAGFLVPTLLSMSLVKFIMVVGWYMHLRYDHNWVKYIFVFSMLLGGSIAIGLCHLI